MTVKDASAEWGVSRRRVSALCANKRIPDAKFLGNMWLLPSVSQKPMDARHSKKRNQFLKPVIKWAGGKSQLLKEISARYPRHLGQSISKYAEPFVGGGAVLFDILEKYDLDKIYISDTNAELINVYKQLKENVLNLIDILSSYEEKYLKQTGAQRKDFYYEMRSKFNHLIEYKKSASTIEGASLFIFLNHTCFNGLYRVNKRGEFNVPMGAYKNPKICDAENLRNVSKALSKVDIVCDDYQKSSEFIDKDTFVYLDPPYRPLSVTSSFTSYTEKDFNDRNQKELAVYVRELADRGAKILLSNSDPKNTDPNDDFFDRLYSQQKIERVFASRMINSNAASRGQISEILVSNY